MNSRALRNEHIGQLFLNVSEFFRTKRKEALFTEMWISLKVKCWMEPESLKYYLAEHPWRGSNQTAGRFLITAHSRDWSSQNSNTSGGGNTCFSSLSIKPMG